MSALGWRRLPIVACALTAVCCTVLIGCGPPPEDYLESFEFENRSQTPSRTNQQEDPYAYVNDDPLPDQAPEPATCPSATPIPEPPSRSQPED